MHTKDILFVGSLLVSQLSKYGVSASPVAQAEIDTTSPRGRANAVKEAFRHSWDGYVKYAWGADELNPIQGGAGNSRNGWGASIVDALSTAILMDDADVVIKALEHIETIDFSKTDSDVSVFETTIRYLGGLVSAYDLLTGPYASTIPADKKHLVESCLDQAIFLADNLKFAFDTPSGIPANDVDIMTKTFDATTNGIATIGTLVLEWTRLSDISGDPSYGNLTQTAESHLLYPKPTKGEVFPGLIGTYLSLKTGEIEVTSGGWSGGDDSFYEYLLKMFIYDKERFAYYGKRWEVAADSTLKFLKSHPPNRPDITFVAEFNSATSISKNQGHLTCFIGGNFLLGGHTLNRRDLKQFGLDLIDGCHHTYANTAAKIGPERFSWADLPADAPESQKAFFAKNGFYTTHGAYILRPETIESYYHGWRLTGDPKYREWAWEAFQAINASCRVPNGYASLRNVDKAPPQTAPGDFYDYQESFWFAETLKYLWLIFGGGKLGEVHVTRAPQEWVFNTEAHPVRVFKKLLLEGREGAEGERKGEATAEEAKTSDGGMGKEGVVPVHRIWAWALAGLVLCGFIV